MPDLTQEALRARAREIVAIESDGKWWRVVLVAGAQRSTVIRLSEREACEAYAAWIQDTILLPTFTTLVAEACKEHEGLRWCLDEVKRALASAGCSHGHEHASTPPMMYPEWIGCVIAHHVAEARRTQREADAGIVARLYLPDLDGDDWRVAIGDIRRDAAAAIRAQEETP